MTGSLLLCVLSLTLACEERFPTGPDTVASISVSPEAATLTRIGEIQQFQAVARDRYGYIIPEATVTWTSSEPSVATVDPDGFVTSRLDGSTHIVATADGVADSGEVTVDIPVSGGDPDWQFRENEPADYVPLTEHDHRSGNGGWSYQNRAGTYEFVRPRDEPMVGGDDGRGVFRSNFPRGLADGHDAANSWRGIQEDVVEFYWAYTFRISADWKNNKNRTKHALWFWGEEIGGHLDLISLAGENGPVYLGFTLKSPGIYLEVKPNYPVRARVSRGEWHQVEFQVVADPLFGNKDFRVWLDGVLVLRRLAVPYDAEGPHLGQYVTEFKYANTYGGGGQNVPHEQFIDVGHTYISGKSVGQLD